MFKLVIAFFYVPDVLLACGSIHQVVNPERFTDESRGRRELNVFSCFLFADSRTNAGVACEQVLPGALAARREKEGELPTKSLEFEFHLQFPCGSSSTELSDFRQSARSGNERECKIKKNIGKHVPKVMTSLLMSSPPISISYQLFRYRYSNSRDVVASSPFLFPPRRKSAPEGLLPG